jgi:VCBS repeat-containing protein
MATFNSNWKFEALTPGTGQAGALALAALDQWKAGHVARTYQMPAAGQALVAQLTVDTTDTAARRELESCCTAQGLRAIHYPG